MPAIDEALRDRALLGAALGDWRTWTTWLAVLRGAFGLSLDVQQRQVFAEVAGGRGSLARPVRELWAIVGRRAGKSKMAAAIAVYLACFVKHRLSAGERGMVLVLAASQEQARVVFNYAKAFLVESPVLRQEIVDATRSEIRLRSGIVIAIHSNSFRTVRGRSLCAAVFDECSMWRDETSSLPDLEVYRSVLPSLLTTRGMLVGISTGYRRVGLLYQKYRDYFGQDSPDTLVVQGGTRQFNGTVDEAEIAAQVAADPAAARSEWFGQFRDDLASYLSDDLIDAAIEPGRPLELSPQPNTVYRAFADASGGVGQDAYTIAIGHKDREDHCILDLVRGTAGKIDPHEVTRQFAALCKEYRVREVIGDSYAQEWVAAAWRGTGVAYRKSELTKSQIYLETVPLFTRGLVRLPDHPRLLRELRLLERQTHRSGKDSVDHPRGGHDDHANSACGALHLIGAAAKGLANISDDAWRRILGDIEKMPAYRRPSGMTPWQRRRERAVSRFV